MLRFAVPSSGSLHDPALDFLKACGIGVSRPNPRKYTAEIPSLPGVVVHFQRQADIPLLVEEGMADVGIVGLDGFLERRREGGDSEIIIERLGFAQSELAIQVPDTWVDVTSMADLADLAIEFRQQGTHLQVATKYPRLTERFLLANGVNFVTLIPSSGALEISPATGSAEHHHRHLIDRHDDASQPPENHPGRNGRQVGGVFDRQPAAHRRRPGKARPCDGSGGANRGLPELS